MSRGFWPSLSLLINHGGGVSCPAGGGRQEGFREERCVQPWGMGRGVPGGQMAKVKVQKPETSHITGASVAHLAGAGGNTGRGSRVGMGRTRNAPGSRALSCWWLGATRHLKWKEIRSARNLCTDGEKGAENTQGRSELKPPASEPRGPPASSLSFRADSVALFLLLQVNAVPLTKASVWGGKFRLTRSGHPPCTPGRATSEAI